jgi:hypothetical protein
MLYAVRSNPARLHEQRMDVCELLDASHDCVFETFGRIGLASGRQPSSFYP